MLLTREMLAVLGAASIDPSRQDRTGLLLDTPGFVVATDGHILATLADKSVMDCQERLENFPALPVGWSVPLSLPAGGLILPPDACKAASKALVGKGPWRNLRASRVAVLAVQTLIQAHQPELYGLAILNSDLAWTINPFRLVEGQFPNWRNVWPKSDEVNDDPIGASLEIGFNAELMIQACKLRLTCLDKSHSSLLAWRLIAPSLGATFQAQDNYRSLAGILMPLRFAKDNSPCFSLPCASALNVPALA